MGAAEGSREKIEIRRMLLVFDLSVYQLARGWTRKQVRT